MTNTVSILTKSCAPRRASVAASVEDQCQSHLATFAHQDIVSSAGRLVIHAFNPDTASSEGRCQARMDESLSFSRSEYHNIGIGGIDLRKMLSCEALKRSRRPGNGRRFRQDDEAAGKTHCVDFDCLIIVASHGLIVLGRGGVELHDLVDPPADGDFRQLEEKDGAL